MVCLEKIKDEYGNEFGYVAEILTSSLQRFLIANLNGNTTMVELDRMPPKTFKELHKINTLL